jgi:sulfhydrogenase subunit beta (sulfur reductase)
MHMFQSAVVTTEGPQVLLNALGDRGYRVVGPTIRDQAIIYDDIKSVPDLPKGWSDEQRGGHYRLARRDDDALFGYAAARIRGRSSSIRQSCVYGARS